MGGFNTTVVAPRTSQILADGDLDMKGYKIVNLRESLRLLDAANLKILIALMG
ncbi:hypothetical protein [Metallosphaera sp.]|uniref:hypothetical protein n=1 Tax=Metallosphaera sp. TaxID=2020860 RepID=UPI0031687254